MPPAPSEIYGGPNNTWLRDLLGYLPNLQSLIVSELPFFDHHSLLALRHMSTFKGSTRENGQFVPTYALRLLLAASELNTTCAGLTEALIHFPSLVYLDLSYTRPTNDPSVLSTFASLDYLRVLKLRGIGLKDREAEILANAISMKVRVLDLRQNALTDAAMRTLIQACILPPTENHCQPALGRQTVEDWPSGPAPGLELMSLELLCSQDLDERIRRQLTSPLTGRLAIEDIPRKGLTHLYIADNYLSVEGVLGLLESSRLHVLDAGSVDTVNPLSRTSPMSKYSSTKTVLGLPGLEKATAVLQNHAGNNLTYLRINHAVITKQIAGADVPLPISAELPGDATRAKIRDSTPLPRALESNEAIIGLSAEASHGNAKLVGDSTDYVWSPSMGQASDADEPVKAPTPGRGEGAFASKLAIDSSMESSHQSHREEQIAVDFTGCLSASKLRSHSSSTTVQPHSPDPLSSSMPSSVEPHPPISTAATEIDRLLHKRTRSSSTAKSTLQPGESYLHPSSLPRLRTLVLTDVPTHVPQTYLLIPVLQTFISACADEAQLTMLQAQASYSLPPGRSRVNAEHVYAKTLFALSTIILEMSPISAFQNNAKSKSTSNSEGLRLSPWVQSHDPHRSGRSSTGDHDSENLWNAAENDFSFFREEGEEQDECVFYENEPQKHSPSAILNGNITLNPVDTGSPSSSTRLRSQEPSIKGPTLLPGPKSLSLQTSAARASSGRGGFEGRERPATASVLRDDKVTASLDASHVGIQAHAEGPLLDVVVELVKFRNMKKREYEASLRRWTTRLEEESRLASTNGLGRSVSPVETARNLPFVEGHWQGAIKIIRNAMSKGRSGLVSDYENYFEKGYLHP